MKIRVGDLIDGWPSVQQLARTELPVAISFRLARAMKRLEPEVQVAQAKRSDLVKEYGEELGDSGQWRVKDDLEDEYLEAYQPLADEEIEVDIEPVKAASLEKLDGQYEIAPAVLAGAWFLFADD